MLHIGTGTDRVPIVESRLFLCYFYNADDGRVTDDSEYVIRLPAMFAPLHDAASAQSFAFLSTAIPWHPYHLRNCIGGGVIPML